MLTTAWCRSSVLDSRPGCHSAFMSSVVSSASPRLSSLNGRTWFIYYSTQLGAFDTGQVSVNIVEKDQGLFQIKPTPVTKDYSSDDLILIISAPQLILSICSQSAHLWQVLSPSKKSPDGLVFLHLIIMIKQIKEGSLSPSPSKYVTALRPWACIGFIKCSGEFCAYVTLLDNT